MQTFCSYCTPLLEPLSSDACFSFTGPIQQIIQEAKFGPNEIKAKQLMGHVQQQALPIKSCNLDAITFVPIHWRRRLTRGFDLSALFARTLSRQLKVPLVDCLVNTRFDKPLTLAASKSDRVASIQGRYKVKTNTQIPKNILLVDDVMTTGATLKACQDILNQAGCSVITFALAKTPWQK